MPRKTQVTILEILLSIGIILVVLIMAILFYINSNKRLEESGA